MSESIGSLYHIVKTTPLAGQASARQYFRLTAEDGKTYVLMQLPPEGNRSISEEAMGKADVSELPFITVQRYLKKIGTAVPEIYFYSDKEGQVLLEDIGDESLERALRGADASGRIALYQQAIDTLLDLQQKTQTLPDPSHIAFQRSFDFELLYWECEHFVEYGIEDFYGKKLPAAERQLFADIFTRLCRELTALPQGFVHRDFQSRNLHLYNDEIVMIDFQDALQGPFVYDLVALLRDSYVQLSPREIDVLLGYYWKNAHSLWKLDEARFRRAFHLQTLQRKLKDTGRFQFIHTVKKNDAFLRYREPSLGYVKAALAELVEYRPLLERLEEWGI